MLVVDASCLFEHLIRTRVGLQVGRRLSLDHEQAAPHIVDVEVFGVIRREHRRERIDRTKAELAIDGLGAWPGERIGHTLLLHRAWQLRDNVQGSNAMYVALAEALGATLLTMDARLATASGPTCEIELFA